MLIWLAREILGHVTAVTPFFKLRGLNLQSTSPGHIVIESDRERSPLYSLYLENMAAYARSALTKMTVFTDAVSYPLRYIKSLEPEDCPLIAPPAIFSFARPEDLGEMMMNKILKEVDAKPIATEKKGSSLYYIGNPCDLEVKHWRILRAGGANFEVSTDGLRNTNLAGVESYNFVKMVLMTVATLHWYPTNPDDSDIGVAGNVGFNVPISHIVDMEIIKGDWYQDFEAMDIDDEPGTSTTTRDPTTPAPPAKKKLVETKDTPAPTTKTRKRGHRGYEWKLAKTLEKEEEKIREYKHKSLSMDSRLQARPAPFYPENIFCSVNTVPFLPGLIFPYARGMFKEDTSYFPKVFSQYRYFRMFDGATKEELRAAHMYFKKSQMSWCKTEEGQELMHAFAGLELALSAQARVIFLVEEERYVGFCLLGTGYRVRVDNTWYEPETDVDLRASLASLTSHTNSLARICDILEKVTISSGKNRDTVQKISPSSILTARDFLELVQTRNISEEIKARIDPLLADLKFADNKYYTRSAENVAGALRLIADPEADISDLPFFISPFTIYNVDRALSVMCAFGSTSFTFLNPQGTKFQVPQSTAKDNFIEPTMSEGKTFPPKIPAIPVYWIKTKEAHSDFKKLMASGCVSFNFKVRAAKSKFTYFENESKMIIWNALKICVGDRETYKKESTTKGKEISSGSANKGEGLDKDALKALFGMGDDDDEDEGVF